jgi:hypothetical protein
LKYAGAGGDQERKTLPSATLVPHNIDSWRQKQLLLITFCAERDQQQLLLPGQSR